MRRLESGVELLGVFWGKVGSELGVVWERKLRFCVLMGKYYVTGVEWMWEAYDFGHQQSLHVTSHRGLLQHLVNQPSHHRAGGGHIAAVIPRAVASAFVHHKLSFHRRSQHHTTSLLAPAHHDSITPRYVSKNYALQWSLRAPCGERN
jgi:hypothetical protein